MTTRRDRIEKVLAGKKPDRVPVSVWMHQNKFDQDPRSLAERMVDFNEEYDYDFIKGMPFGAYTTPDWGAKLEITCDSEVEVVAPGIVEADEYFDLPYLPPYYGTWGKTLQTAEWVKKILNQRGLDDTPFLQTIFSPASTLNKLTKGGFKKMHKENPMAVHHALQVITDTTIDFVLANLDAGVDGFFFATQCAGKKDYTDLEFAELAKPYDLQVIDAYVNDPRAWFNVLHIHGNDTRFETVCEYPVQVVSWHDRQAGCLTMAEAKKLACCKNKVFLGGLKEGPHIRKDGTLDYESILFELNGKKDAEKQIEKHIHEAIDMMDGKNIIIGPGCVADPGSSTKNLHAVRKAVSSWKKK